MSTTNNFYSMQAGAYGPGGSFPPPQQEQFKEPLTVAETLSLHLEFAGKGLYDAMNVQPTIAMVQEDPEIQAHVMRSAILNALSITSVVAFNFFIMPLLDPKNEKWFHRHFEALYQAVWLAPLVGLSLYLNLRWCSLIANRAFSIKHGRKAINASPYTGMVSHIASSAYRAILIASYLILTFVLAYVPYFGSVITFLYICWVNSYYCFEYLWIARGMTLPQRVKHEEERWAYYLAFGFPSAIACMWGSSLANAAIFALLFPWFIIQAMNATPVPWNPQSPSSSQSQTQDAPVSPHHLVPIRLHVFAPVIVVNDALVRLLSVTGTSRATKRSLGLQSTIAGGEGELLGSDAIEAGISPISAASSSHARSPSAAFSGASFQQPAYGYASPSPSPVSPPTGTATRQRVVRRKLD